MGLCRMCPVWFALQWLVAPLFYPNLPCQALAEPCGVKIEEHRSCSLKRLIRLWISGTKYQINLVCLARVEHRRVSVKQFLVKIVIPKQVTKQLSEQNRLPFGQSQEHPYIGVRISSFRLGCLPCFFCCLKFLQRYLKASLLLQRKRPQPESAAHHPQQCCQRSSSSCSGLL